MKQRVPSRGWYSPGRPGHRPRVLVEDDHPALAISDFSRFEQAGFDVAYCSGPGAAAGCCPVLRGQRCALVEGADAVLHGLDPGLGVAAAIRRRHPGTAVIEPPGACSVPGQVAAVRQALTRPGR
jgi:hypothetical protein